MYLCIYSLPSYHLHYKTLYRTTGCTCAAIHRAHFYNMKETVTPVKISFCGVKTCIKKGINIKPT